MFERKAELDSVDGVLSRDIGDTSGGLGGDTSAARLRRCLLVDPSIPCVRLANSQWPEDAPRGAVSTFCAEDGISRKSFYELGRRARVDGPAPVPSDLPADTVVKTVSSAGVFKLNKVFYNVGARHGFKQVLVINDGDRAGDKITSPTSKARSSSSTSDPHPE